VRIITVLFVFSILFSSVLARGIKPYRIDPHRTFMGKISKVKVRNFYEDPGQRVQDRSANSELNTGSSQTLQLVKRASDHSFTTLIDSSRNGFGWLNPSIRSISHYKGADAFGADVDFLLLAYRQYIVSNTATGIIGATTIDVANDLSNGAFFRHVNLNEDLGPFPPADPYKSIGGRYPGAVALDRPFIHFNQYISGNADTSPAVSSPYLITDYGTYGNNGGAWTGSYQMDQGYQHWNFEKNRLWNGPVSIVKSSDGKYHYVGVYRNWMIKGESQPAEYVILNAESDDPTTDWTIDTDPTTIDTMNFFLYPSVSMNSSGFGACVGIGHEGPHPGNTFYLYELRVMVMTTTDYGKTWTTPRQIDWAELGVPESVTYSDSIYIPTSDTTQALYQGDVYLAIPNNHGLDVLVSDDQDVYVGYDLTWGPQASDSTYYRDYHECGVHVAISNDGGASFEDKHMAINNGFFEGDSLSDAVEDNFIFNSEVDLSLDQYGYLYATWLDRPHVNIEPAEHLRYNDPNETIGLKTDVFTSRSLDGGETWSWKMNVTQTQSVDEYELKAAMVADGKDNGTVYFAYSTIDPSTSVSQGDPDAYTYRTNRIWVGQAWDYPDSGALAIGAKSRPVIKTYRLEQNYPNPFNPTTTISYELPVSGKVRLVVYNVLGQKVRTLIDEKQGAGKYKMTLDASELSSGVYFYRLSAGKSDLTRKMILIK